MPGWLGLTSANEILNFLYRGTAVTIGSSLWMRFLVVPSSRSGGGTETNYGGYARLETVRGTSLFGNAAANGQLTNTVAIALAVATTAGNGNLVWFDFVDTPSGAFAKLYNGGPILPPKVIVVGKAPTFGIGKLIFTL